MQKNKFFLFTVLVILATVFLTACGSPAEEPAAEEPMEEEMDAEAPMEEEAMVEPLTVGFIYIGQPGDLGWTYEHDRGRLMLEETLGDKVETVTVPDVPEGPDAEKAIRDLVEAGAEVVFTTSFGYMDPTITVAEQYPDVVFEHCSGYKTADNVATYFGRIYQPRYLSGLVAGSMTEENVIGYVAAFPLPEVIRGINAFTLGVREVNPEAEVRVVWTNTWYDPVIEREAAEALLDQGADLIAQHQDTTEPQKAAAARGLYSIGYDADMAKFVGDSVLTSPVWNWAPYYISTVQAVIDGTWETHQYWGGLADNAVVLADLSPNVPEDVAALVDAAQADLVGGATDVFCGPINDQAGAVAVAEGECMDDGAMLGMDWFVEGVVGTIE